MYRTITTAHVAEFFQEQSADTISINLDTLGNTFCNYKKLNVIDTFIKNESVDFKKLINFIKVNKDRHIIIDSGVCVFSPLLHYFINNNVFSIFKKLNIELRIMYMIEGGFFIQDYLKDFYILSQIPQIQLICVNDERDAPTIIKNKEFFETKLHKESYEKNIIFGEFNINQISPVDKIYLIKMMKKGEIISDIAQSEFKYILFLKQYKRRLWKSFDQAFSNDTSQKTTMKQTKALHKSSLSYPQKLLEQLLNN